MCSPVIQVENLGKRYCIRHQADRQRYVTLRDVLADKTKSLARRLWSAARSPVVRGSVVNGPSSEDFWALKDVSFEVKQGETLGIIGRNGAGKSTLLKILSRITEPTEGRVCIRGRVASLLEVGTGFHPELTGRENIFLNGAILGMTRAEIKSRFDDIVEFAEIQKFLDTPVKRYSSGMYVRLAFAVAAHLDPEILVVDEVLAVGDAAFQRKCIRKISDVARGGRTVLFVSHNMEAVEALTTQAMLLASGRLEHFGPTQAAVTAYRNFAGYAPGIVRTPDSWTIEGQYSLEIEAVMLRADGIPTVFFPMGASLEVELTYSYHDAPAEIVIGLGVDSFSGNRIVSLNSLYDAGQYIKLSRKGRLRCELGRLPLTPGLYQLKIALVTAKGLQLVELSDVLAFEVLRADVYKKGIATDPQKGVFFWFADWSSTSS